MAINGFEHLGDLRVVDLIAKTSKISIRDAIPVLLAAKAVCEFLDMTLEDIVPGDGANAGGKPTPQNILACEQAFTELLEKMPDAVQSTQLSHR